MSWQQPSGNYNPNAGGYNPNAGGYNPNAGAYNPNAGGYNPNAGGYAPQGGYGGGYNPNAGGYNPNAGGYNPNAGGYNPNAGGYNPNAGGYNPNAGGYNPNAGGYAPQGGYGGGYNPNAGGYNPRGGYNQDQGYQPQGGNQQYNQPKPAAPAPAVEAKTSHADAAKLTLGGTSSGIVMPKRKGGATLSLGKKKEEEKAKEEKANEESKAEEAKAEEDKKEGESAPAAAPAAKKPAAGDNTAKMTPEELREHVKKEIAKQRTLNKRSFTRDPRPHFNVVFCGHVDAGKSTISGHLLMEKGMIDQREMDKLKREAQQHHREGWEYAYAMDISEDERAKGITRETGAAYFETEKRRITVLDAPGHKAFVPSMIGGATQAEICVLVISSRTGEFETGFEKGGQTREHAMLVRTCGVRHMICVINKMDEMQWSQERFDEIVGKLRPFLKQNGYEEQKAKNLVFIPIAGLTGENLIKHTADGVCPWYTGPTMMEVIDDLVLPETKTEEDVLCLPLVGGYKDDGKTYIYGKVESGSIAVGEKLQVLPTAQEALVEGISIESTEFEKCFPGDNVHLRVRGIDESDIHTGYVATSIPTSLRAVEYFQARVVILDVKNIICAGSRFMLHIHAAQEEASFHKLLAKVDKRTGEVLEKEPACAKAGDVVIARIEIDRPVVVEPHKDFDKMGRFMMRDDGKTIAIGLVMKLYESTKESLAKKA